MSTSKQTKQHTRRPPPKAKKGCTKIPLEFVELAEEVATAMAATGAYTHQIMRRIRELSVLHMPNRPVVGEVFCKKTVEKARRNAANQINKQNLKDAMDLVLSNAVHQLRDAENKNKFYPSRVVLELAQYQNDTQQQLSPVELDTVAEKYKNDAFSQHTLAQATGG